MAEWEWYQTATDEELDERQRARDATIARRRLEVAEEQRLEVAEEQQRLNQRVQPPFVGVARMAGVSERIGKAGDAAIAKRA